MGAWGIGHWVVVAVIVMLLFGRGKVSELMGDVAKGIKAFKKGMSEEDENPKPQQVNTSEPMRTLPHQANEPAPMAGVHAPADRKVI